MKKTITPFPFCMMLAVGVVYSVSVNAQSITNDEDEMIDATGWHCGQTEYENHLRSQDPDFDKKREEMEKTIQENIENMKLIGNPQTNAVYTIPVVVHVVWNTSTQNLTDAQVIAAIDKLNKDYSKQNSYTAKTPAVWKPLAADMGIQFCLATIDPNGNPTTGIVHKQTSATSFAGGSTAMKSSATGSPPWDVTKYYNIWICNISGGVLGWAPFPPISSGYGAVVHYCGVKGTCPPYHLNRTMTHELGHAFALYHNWGSSSCGTDYVSDTPQQAGYNGGCPSFPRNPNACGTTNPDGDMFMNIMDYSNDACTVMFTAGQKTRAQAVIAGYLMALANNSATACATATGMDDMDIENYVSIFPNPSSGEFTIYLPVPQAGNLQSTIYDLNVYNVFGEKVFSAANLQINQSSNLQIDLSSQPSGIYFVEVNTNPSTGSGGRTTKKFVLNK